MERTLPAQIVEAAHTAERAEEMPKTVRVLLAQLRGIAPQPIRPTLITVATKDRRRPVEHVRQSHHVRLTVAVPAHVP